VYFSSRQSGGEAARGVVRMSDDKKQVVFLCPREDYETADKKTGHGEMSEELREKVQEIAYGTEVTERKRLREQLEEEREDKRDIEQEIENLRHKRDEKERRIANKERRLEELMETDGEYEGYLQAIESDLRDGKRIYVNHGKAERAAELGNCDPADVVKALKERNPDLPEEAFQEAKLHEEADWQKQTQ
jgi:septal ring factor EnvC (AmiA/AmiB activator)